MICPKCKAKVSPDDINCPNCNLRLIFECPRCKSPTRLGSTSCKKCGYTFVKFCPKCHSANYATSSKCRKCGYEFNSDENQLKDEIYQKSEKHEKINQSSKKTNAKILIDEEKKAPITHDEANIFTKKLSEIDIKKQKVENQEPPLVSIRKEPLVDKTLLFYIDFINLERTFEKFDNKEFKQKVIENIKTTTKIAFGIDCEFHNSHCVVFKYKDSLVSKIKDKIDVFEQEFIKFNQILEKTLDTGLTYKFIVSTVDEVQKNPQINQLKFGSDKDIIVSSGAYLKLKNELSLIKIAPDSYKMIFLEQKPAFEQQEDEKYDKALEIILNTLADTNSNIRAISLNAQRGSGKTHLLNDLYYRLSKVNHETSAIFYAQCSALTQIGSYGLIQNFFMSLFNYPLILKDDFNMKAFEKKVLDYLGVDKIEEAVLETLANLLYPLKKDYYENILINKEITYKYLKDVFEYVKKIKNVIFIIDDFDLIDESSYGFLKYLVENDYFSQDARMILSYKNKNSVAIYFQTNKLNVNQCLNVSLKSSNIIESKDFVKKVLGQDCEVQDEIISQIAYNAQGNIAYIEQVVQYLFEKKYFVLQDNKVKFKKEALDINLPDNLEKCFNERLLFLKEQNIEEYKFLCISSLLGDKLDYQILSSVFNLSENDFFEIIASLDKKGYLKRKVGDVYGFKNSLTWSYCYIMAKEEETIKQEAKKLLEILQDKILAIPLICPILAQITNNKELAYTLWTKSLRSSSFIGDVNIYSMAQKQCLILLESVKIENFDYVKNNICERLGKIIYKKNPAEAKDYLTNALISAQKNYDTSKIIDLSGYLTKSTYLTQDFNGVVEIVDNVLKYFDKNDKSVNKSDCELQIALIKTRKLQALLQLGCWEELSSLVNTEINPILQKHLSFFSKRKWIAQDEIFQIWIEANIILAQSYSEQGSPLAFELINEIEHVLNKEKHIKTDYLGVQLAYARAIANTSKGYFDESNAILDEIIKNYSYIIDSPNLVCKWNIISLINKILKLDFQTIKDDLFEATAYANNCNDEVAKNIIKTLLAYVFLEEKAYLKAIEVATNQMQFFSSKKLAFGALLAWYISASATAHNKADTYCIEICEKAVKICENAQNNNYYFKILFQELLAKVYLKLNDLENASMYCDLALQSACVNELMYLQVRLEILKVAIAREKLPQQVAEKKQSYAKNVIKMYNKTIELTRKLNLTNYVLKIEKEITSFRAYCQLNRILEDK